MHVEVAKMHLLCWPCLSVCLPVSPHVTTLKSVKRFSQHFFILSLSYLLNITSIPVMNSVLTWPVLYAQKDFHVGLLGCNAMWTSR
jgi:hypothetical protein